jgi:hypothetical protein
MTEKSAQNPASKGRRALLKTLVAGGAAAVLLPERWTRPVIDKIMVPAHAQGTVVDLSGIYVSYPHSQNGASASGLFERFVDALVPAAHAEPYNEFQSISLCNTACIALEVLSNNSVLGYVNGATGTSTLDPSTRTIETFTVFPSLYCNTTSIFKVEESNVAPSLYYVPHPQAYTLVNCVIDAGGSAVDGDIFGDECIGGSFKALAADAIPPACSLANVSCVSMNR